MKAPVQLKARYKGHDLKAQLLADGRVEFDGKPYRFCSGAAVGALKKLTGKKLSVDGWGFWQYTNEDGKLVPLKAARQAFLVKKST